MVPGEPVAARDRAAIEAIARIGQSLAIVSRRRAHSQEPIGNGSEALEQVQEPLGPPGPNYPGGAAHAGQWFT
jgi:hypothetical protein